MRPIGGELELDYQNLPFEVTDSGRSSLRLILKSGLKDKRFLIPDYLCEVIVKVFDELKVNYAFYKVNKDFTTDVRQIEEQDFDVLYVINYFGQKNSLLTALKRDDITVIEDDVFSPVVEKTAALNNWVGFNSLRKISALADGSIVQSSGVNIDPNLIIQIEAQFCMLKYEAKRIKYEHIRQNKHKEDDYLNIFEKGEALLDEQRDIFPISKVSLQELLKLYKHLGQENFKREENYKVLDRYLSEYKIPISPKYYSFYPCAFEKRDELKKFLFENKIFLPAHWPKFKGVDNILYDQILSVPLDSRYSSQDLERTGQLIIEFLGAKKEAVVT